MHKWIWVHTKNELGEQAATAVSSEMSENRHGTIALPTGSTPLPMYERLVDMITHGVMSLSMVSFFNLDEYWPMPPSDPTSYSSFLWSNFLSKVGADAANVHFISGDCADPANECSRYERKLTAAGGLDLAILGIGANGHIGFNEPGDGWDQGVHLVALSDQTRLDNDIYFPDAHCPRMAITMGIQTMLSARRIVVLAYGEKKRMPIKSLQEGRVTATIPATSLLLHDNVTFIVDATLRTHADTLYPSLNAQG